MEPFIGMILVWAPTFTPRAWASCEGALLPINQNSSLFALIGTTYGGDGRTTMALPDLRGRVPMGIGRHPGSAYTYRQGQTGGAETVTLSIQQMPQHSHAAAFTGSAFSASLKIPAIDNVNATTNIPSSSVYFAKGTVGSGFSVSDANTYAAGTANTQVGPSLGVSGVSAGSVAVGNTGSSQGHYNIQPFQILRYVIALTGIFPSRS